MEPSAVRIAQPLADDAARHGGQIVFGGDRRELLRQGRQKNGQRDGEQDDGGDIAETDRVKIFVEEETPQGAEEDKRDSYGGGQSKSQHHVPSGVGSPLAHGVAWIDAAGDAAGEIVDVVLVEEEKGQCQAYADDDDEQTEEVG